VDAYANVTLDSVSALKFAVEHILTKSWSNSSSHVFFTINYLLEDNSLDFLLIADDDTYVNLPLLMSFLHENQSITPVNKNVN